MAIDLPFMACGESLEVGTFPGALELFLPSDVYLQ